MIRDPDGNEKRRARKGERRCGGCVQYCSHGIVWESTGPHCCLCPKYTRCRADDYAGDCKHYTESGR